MTDRILEIGQYAAGYCGRLFVRTGAEVARVQTERSPAWASDTAMDAYLHAGKKSVATDDADLIAQLASQADVIICEAATSEAVDALGFKTWQCPVKLAITPFGLTGPKQNWQATSATLLAMGGYTNLVGDPGRAPLTLPGHYVDFQTGALGFTAANACLLAQQSDNIDLSMLETVMSLSQFTTVRWHCTGDIRERHGNDFYFVAPSNLFRCQDGWVYINIVPNFWDAFTVFADLPELLIDDRFTTNDLRIEHGAALFDLTAAALKDCTKAELVDRAGAARIPLGVVMSFDDVLSDPHLAQRDFWETVTIGDQSLTSAGIPWCINNEPRPELSVATNTSKGFN